MSSPTWLARVRRFWPTILLVVLPAMLIVALLIHAIVAAMEFSETKKLSQTYAQLTGTPLDALAKAGSQRDEMVKRMTKNRWIAQPVQLTGVFGDSAIFNGGMMVKAGQPVGDMTVIAVGPNWVQVNKDGVEQKLWVFQPLMSAPPMMAPPPVSAPPAASVTPTSTKKQSTHSR